MLSNRIENRLYNFKFASAQRYVEADGLDVVDLTENEKTLIKTLSDLLGDTGWISGDLTTVIVNALENIGVNFNDGL